jgi:hypothetical protein
MAPLDYSLKKDVNTMEFISPSIVDGFSVN